MNKKELAEIKRRIKPDRMNISHIYGCYVNAEKEIIARIDESFAVLTKEEQEKYLSLLKKSLSGSLGRNLLDITFSTKQVMEGEEHKLLSSLRRTGLKDPFILDEFYKAVAENIKLEDSSYLVLIAYDRYDVPDYNKAGERLDESSSVFDYLLCTVCPVKPGKSVLSYSSDDSRFHSGGLSQIVSAPEFGFMFPAFDDRSANIYNALFYSRSTKGLNEDFISAIFNTDLPVSPAKQKDGFSEALAGALKEDCSLETVQSVTAELRDMITAHKESGTPETLEITYEDVADILERSGAAEEERKKFVSICAEELGENKVLNPENLINTRSFEIETESVKIKASPEISALIRTEIIDGRKYILIPADAGAEVNGIAIKI